MALQKRRPALMSFRFDDDFKYKVNEQLEKDSENSNLSIFAGGPSGTRLDQELLAVALDKNTTQYLVSVTCRKQTLIGFALFAMTRFYLKAFCRKESSSASPSGPTLSSFKLKAAKPSPVHSSSGYLRSHDHDQSLAFTLSIRSSAAPSESSSSSSSSKLFPSHPELPSSAAQPSSSSSSSLAASSSSSSLLPSHSSSLFSSKQPRNALRAQLFAEGDELSHSDTNGENNIQEEEERRSQSPNDTPSYSLLEDEDFKVYEEPDYERYQRELPQWFRLSESAANLGALGSFSLSPLPPLIATEKRSF
eukprot:g695.t1